MSRLSIVAVAASLFMASSAFASTLYPSHAVQNVAQPGNNKHKIKGGIVSASGSIVGGKGYSVSHDGTGLYTIDVPAGFFGSTCPVILLTPAGQNGQTPIANDFNYITCGGSGQVKMQIRIRGNSDGSFQDNAFHFLMIEP